MPTHEDIAREAYKLWEERGRPSGLQDEIWLSAEARLIEPARSQWFRGFFRGLERWGPTASHWATVLGIVGALVVFYEWEVARGDHAVDFLLKLDDKFNSADVIEGRNLIDWDFEYQEITNELEIVSDQEKLLVENKRRSGLPPEKLKELKIADDKIKKPDQCLQFYQTLNMIHKKFKVGKRICIRRGGVQLSPLLRRQSRGEEVVSQPNGNVVCLPSSLT